MPDNTLDGYIAELVALKDKYPDYLNMLVVTERDYSDTEVILYGEREENDHEYDRRISIEDRVKADARKAKKDRDERERKEFERLKKKFEGK
jgi:hypothetical protein